MPRNYSKEPRIQVERLGKNGMEVGGADYEMGGDLIGSPGIDFGEGCMYTRVELAYRWVELSPQVGVDENVRVGCLLISRI